MMYQNHVMGKVVGVRRWGREHCERGWKGVNHIWWEEKGWEGGKDRMIWRGGNSRERKKGEEESGERGEDSGKEVDDVWRGGKDGKEWKMEQ